MAHTPGPWRVARQCSTLVEAENGRNICSAGGYSTNFAVRETLETNEANANLIAAAPELLKALERAEELCGKALPVFDWGKSPLTAEAIMLLNEVPGEISAAIAKARGQS